MLTLVLVLQLGVLVDLSAKPSPGGFVDAELKRRQDSMFDLQAALSSLGTEVSTLSDLKLMVTSSAREKTGELHTQMRNRPEVLGGGQRAETAEVEAFVVRVELRFKDYKTEFVGADKTRISWRTAARDAAKQIRAWLLDNQARVCAESRRSCG